MSHRLKAEDFLLVKVRFKKVGLQPRIFQAGGRLRLPPGSSPAVGPELKLAAATGLASPPAACCGSQVCL